MITKDKWEWMPHAGHLIVGDLCQFHLTTRIGKYLVSTVGEYLPEYQVREIFAESRGVDLQGKGDARKADYMQKIGFEEIGYDRKYETMVFKAVKCKPNECLACKWRQASGSDVDMVGYQTPSEASAGHLRMCQKWAKKQ